MVFGTLFALAALGTSPTPDSGKIVAASLFKNGYAVVVREAPLVRGEAAITPPVNAVLGTLWVSGSRGVSIQKVNSEWVETQGQRDATSLDEILQANFEKNVVIETGEGHPGQSTTVAGRIISNSGPIIVVEGESDRIMIFKTSIQRVTGVEHGLGFRVPTTDRTNVLKIKANGEGKVYVVSLQRGIMWAPAYQVDLLDDNNLTITAKATILNDLSELDNVDVNLVTGFPNMRFLGMQDPLTSGMSVDQFVQTLTSAVTDLNYRREAVLQNQSARGAGGFRDDMVQMQPTGSGQQLEDLFLYKQPGVTLKVGERGYYVVFQAKAEYKQEYTIDIPDTDWNSPRPVISAADQEPLDVWHTLKFKNTAGQPFTTGPVLTMKGGEVMGQDMLNYTTAGAEASVKVTKALDIHAESVEEELSRERGALKIDGRAVYDKVTLKGTVEIKNNKPKAVQLNVTKMSSGEVVEAGGGTVKKTPAGLRQVNPISEIVWKPKLESGKSLRLEYKVTVFVPSTGY